MDHVDVVIVGAGHAGANAAIVLRQQKFEGSLLIIGAEPDLPYERPPLSKEYLSGEKALERLLIRPPTFWTERDVQMLLGVTVVTVNARDKYVVTDTGRTVGYGKLIWAAGGAPRRLTCAGHDLAGVHTVRTRADVDRMAAELPTVDRVVIVGGGYIGLEAAAVLTQAGKQVVLLEAMDRLLARVAGEPLSRFYEAEHRAHGVDVRLEQAVDCLLGSMRVSGVQLADGEVVPADLVIVGVGITPAVAPLIEAGAEGVNGVRVDEKCRTSLSDIFAIGDCALHANTFAGGTDIRIESVQNANDQAAVVARTILGQESTYHAVPWFWSHQYDLKLQTVGLSTGFDECIVRGDIGARSFSVLYLRAGRIVALDCVNAVRDYVQGRRLVEVGAMPDRSLLPNVQIPLKDLG